MTVSYITGDATDPIIRPAIIMHVCNDIGGWGRGFVLALSKKWLKPEVKYRSLPSHTRLGSVQFVPVEDGIVVANMIAQHGIYRCSGCEHPPIRYDALATCLESVLRYPMIGDEGPPPDGWTIHAPRLGAGLAGGDWRVIEALIEKTFKDRIVYIYDLP